MWVIWQMDSGPICVPMHRFLAEKSIHPCTKIMLNIHLAPKYGQKSAALMRCNMPGHRDLFSRGNSNMGPKSQTTHGGAKVSRPMPTHQVLATIAQSVSAYYVQKSRYRARIHSPLLFKCFNRKPYHCDKC